MIEEHEKTHRAIVVSFFSMLVVFLKKTVRSTLIKRHCRRRGLYIKILNLRGFYIRYIIEGVFIQMKLTWGVLSLKILYVTKYIF